jgi:hypothetical protein
MNAFLMDSQAVGHTALALDACMVKMAFSASCSHTHSYLLHLVVQPLEKLLEQGLDDHIRGDAVGQKLVQLTTDLATRKGRCGTRVVSQVNRSSETCSVTFWC